MTEIGSETMICLVADEADSKFKILCENGVRNQIKLNDSIRTSETQNDCSKN